jgi:hypothetical protein
VNSLAAAAGGVVLALDPATACAGVAAGVCAPAAVAHDRRKQGRRLARGMDSRLRWMAMN